MADQELSTIAQAIGRMMAAANSQPEPEVQTREGSMMSAYFALAGEVATFQVGTPFGYDVRVTVSKAGGMFSG